MLKLLFAWFAAVLFAISLGFFLYAYFVRFDTSVPAAGVAAPVLLDLLLFSIFALHHSLFARTGLKRFVTRHVPPALERSTYTVVASLLFLAVCWCWQPVPGTAWRLEGAWRWLGYGLQAAGIGITVLGARALDALDLAGVRQVMRDVKPAPERGAAPLTTTGVYGLVRHPLYFGWTLLVFGAPDMTLTRLVFALVSTAYLLIAIPFEERGLIETFGADYASYQQKVRSRIFPGLL